MVHEPHSVHHSSWQAARHSGTGAVDSAQQHGTRASSRRASLVQYLYDIRPHLHQVWPDESEGCMVGRTNTFCGCRAVVERLFEVVTIKECKTKEGMGFAVDGWVVLVARH